MGSNRTDQILLDTRLRESKARVSPAERADVELSHACHIHVNFIQIVSDAINILKVDAMKMLRVFIDRVTPGGRWSGWITI
jgi:hypothetical protein